MILLITAFFSDTLQAQTTISTPYARLAANQSITINFQNNNAFDVALTNITGGLNLISGNTANIAVFYKTTPVNGLPGNIASGNGWILFGSAYSVVGNGAGTNQSLVNTNLIIPAGATYGVCISASPTSGGRGVILYSNVNIGRDTTTTGNCSIITGTNVGYAGLLSGPTVTPRYFAGAITFVKATPCSGNPSPGTTKSSVAGSCTGIPFTLSTSSPVVGGTSGITYQWQSSTAGAVGSYTNIPSATNVTYTTTQTAATYYQLVVTCANGGAVSNSTPLLVGFSNVCYCAASGASSGGGTITNVTFAEINQSSNAIAGYENFLTDTASVIKGASYPISFTNTTAYTDARFHVWIDFNQNGSFEDPGESVFITPSSALAYPVSGNISIPATAFTGVTRMRVRMDFYDTATPNATSCGTSDFGQVEDYSINIIPCIPITFTTQPIAQSVACQGTATFTAAVNANGSLPVFQWQFRTSPTGVFQNVPNTLPYSGVNTKTLTITNVSDAMNGYEYRVSISGPCTASNPSNSVSLTVTPLIATVSPASSTICAGSIQQLVITNTAPPSTIQFCSGNINLAIPDVAGPPVSTPAAADAGINHSIPVVIPAGALIASINVKLNVTHTYIGDLVVVLKAPNGKILNLIYHKSGTGGGASGGGANFLNTIISSTGTASISSGSAPFTGTFKADASVGAGSYGDVAGSGPTAFQPDVTAFSSLFSIPNGNWTIAIADHREWAGDFGVLNDWCIEFNYGAPATGIFTGPAGTIFTDAMATTPYTGTPVNTVFVKPTATGAFNYAVVVSNAICITDTLKIPVSVNSPVGGSPTLTSTSVCVGNTASLKLAGTLTGGPGFAHNFQVSSNGGLTYSNIANGGVYSGVNTNTLTLTNVPLSFNGYRFRDSVNTGANCGSVISTVATLAVNPIPVVTISAAPKLNLFPGLTTTLTASVSSATGPITYQWFRNGVPVLGAMSSTLVVKIDGVGVYSVKATAQGCSSADSTTTPQTITIGDSSGVTKLFIYPSPNNGKFQVRYFSDINNGSKNPAMLNVYDEKGTRVFSKNYGISSGYQQMNVDLGSHSSGIYRVELLDLNGDRIKTGSVFVF